MLSVIGKVLHVDLGLWQDHYIFTLSKIDLFVLLLGKNLTFLVLNRVRRICDAGEKRLLNLLLLPMDGVVRDQYSVRYI